MVERCKLATLNTQLHDHSFSCLRTGTSIKSGGLNSFFYGTKYNKKAKCCLVETAFFKLISKLQISFSKFEMHALYR